jgi:hypothetical protein
MIATLLNDLLRNALLDDTAATKEETTTPLLAASVARTPTAAKMRGRRKRPPMETRLLM